MYSVCNLHPHVHNVYIQCLQWEIFIFFLSFFLHHQQQQQCLKMDQVSTMCTWKKMNVSMNGNDDDNDSSLSLFMIINRWIIEPFFFWFFFFCLVFLIFVFLIYFFHFFSCFQFLRTILWNSIAIEEENNENSWLHDRYTHKYTNRGITTSLYHLFFTPLLSNRMNEWMNNRYSQISNRIQT